MIIAVFTYLLQQLALFTSPVPTSLNLFYRLFVALIKFLYQIYKTRIHTCIPGLSYRHI